MHLRGKNGSSNPSSPKRKRDDADQNVTNNHNKLSQSEQPKFPIHLIRGASVVSKPDSNGLGNSISFASATPIRRTHTESHISFVGGSPSFAQALPEFSDSSTRSPVVSPIRSDSSSFEEDNHGLNKSGTLDENNNLQEESSPNTSRVQSSSSNENSPRLEMEIEARSALKTIRTPMVSGDGRTTPIGSVVERLDEGGFRANPTIFFSSYNLPLSPTARDISDIQDMGTPVHIDYVEAMGPKTDDPHDMDIDDNSQLFDSNLSRSIFGKDDDENSDREIQQYQNRSRTTSPINNSNVTSQQESLYAFKLLYENTSNTSSLYFGGSQSSEISSFSLTNDFVDCSVIGSGNSANVFHVKEKGSGHKYAIKKCKSQFTSYAIRDWMMREIEIMQLVCRDPCPYILQLVRAWQEDGFMFVQLDLAGKGNLLDLMNRLSENQEYVPEKSLWHIIHDVGSGLEHIHSRHVVHLDIKPANILISDDARLMIGDFGNAYILEGTSIGLDGVEGDARYMAPELLESNVSLAADIFSLGITLYELWNCVPRRDEESSLPIRGQVWHDLREGRVPALRSGCSDTLSNTILDMMRVDRDTRPTATALRQTAQRYYSDGVYDQTLQSATSIIVSGPEVLSRSLSFVPLIQDLNDPSLLDGDRVLTPTNPNWPHMNNPVTIPSMPQHHIYHKGPQPPTPVGNTRIGTPTSAYFSHMRPPQQFTTVKENSNLSSSTRPPQVPPSSFLPRHSSGVNAQPSSKPNTSIYPASPSPKSWQS